MSEESLLQVGNGRPVPTWRALAGNLPYGIMILLGSAIFWLGPGAGWWRWLLSGLYLACGAGGTLWVTVLLCPYCRLYGSRRCPCGYDRIAVRLRPKKDDSLFDRHFKRRILGIVPLWIAPPLAAGAWLLGNFSYVLLVLLAVFLVHAFVILPVVSVRTSCARCPQKQDCSWMSRRRARPSPPPGAAS
jgi:hypothetical protein